MAEKPQFPRRRVGRPRKAVRLVTVTTLRLSEDEHFVFTVLGGPKWLRQYLDAIAGTTPDLTPPSRRQAGSGSV